MKSVLIVINLLLSVQYAVAEELQSSTQQPRQNVAQEAFLQSECKQKESKVLHDQGFESQSTSTSLVAAQWHDEGVEGYYLATTYFQKGNEPWERVSATVVAMITISHGQVGSVTCLDALAAAKALLNSEKSMR